MNTGQNSKCIQVHVFKIAASCVCVCVCVCVCSLIHFPFVHIALVAGLGAFNGAKETAALPLYVAGVLACSQKVGAEM